MVVILINGVPGSGKTTLAYRIANEFGVELVIQTDMIKDIFKLDNYPELATSASHQAWCFIGDKTAENIIIGFEKQAKFFEDFLLKFMESGIINKGDIIIEGIHATPKLFSLIKTKKKIGFFLKVDDMERKIRYDLKNKKRLEKNLLWYENSDVISILGKCLEEKSKEKKFVIVENNDLGNSLNYIKTKIKTFFEKNNDI